MKKLLLSLLAIPSPGLMAQNRKKNYAYVDQYFCGLSKLSKTGKIGYTDKDGNIDNKLLH